MRDAKAQMSPLELSHETIESLAIPSMARRTTSSSVIGCIISVPSATSALRARIAVVPVA
jgi:hypothetical protein